MAATAGKCQQLSHHYLLDISPHPLLLGYEVRPLGVPLEFTLKITHFDLILPEGFRHGSIALKRMLQGLGFSRTPETELNPIRPLPSRLARLRLNDSEQNYCTVPSANVLQVGGAELSDLLNYRVPDYRGPTVESMTNIGQGYSQLEEVCCNKSSSSHGCYIQRFINAHGRVWRKLLKKKLAMKEGRVNKETGTPKITDGAWSKRSYKTNYNDLSGVVTFQPHAKFI
ncbi:hypothetical protein J6590_028895 [Homalodisca vitripennis]|nr:hypothetical protein J6590_028895 [Homalodisca vitripennis]